MCLLGFQRRLNVERMGLVSYGPMLALQEQRHLDVAQGEADDTLFLLQHDPVITLGKNTKDGHILATSEDLAQEGVEVFRTGRGGDVTYHGPGQIVGYPILALQEEERDIRRYVTLLEEVLIRTVGALGVDAVRVEGLRGIWVGNEKLAAVGVRVAQWTTMHGFAMNVSTHLQDFEAIVPCGLHGRGVTSLERLLGRSVEISDVEDHLMEQMAYCFDRDVVEKPATPLPNAAASFRQGHRLVESEGAVS